MGSIESAVLPTPPPPEVVPVDPLRRLLSGLRAGLQTARNKLRVRLTTFCKHQPFFSMLWHVPHKVGFRRSALTTPQPWHHGSF